MRLHVVVRRKYLTATVGETRTSFPSTFDANPSVRCVLSFFFCK